MPTMRRMTRQEVTRLNSLIPFAEKVADDIHGKGCVRGPKGYLWDKVYIKELDRLAKKEGLWVDFLAYAISIGRYTPEDHPDMGGVWK